MTANDARRQEPVGTDDRIDGPFPGYDKYGNLDHEYYKCSRCGAESVNKHGLRWCC